MTSLRAPATSAQSTTKTKTQFVTLLAVAALAAVFAQGPLTPPGTPSPTMKTLDQIEARIDLVKAPASAVQTTDPNYEYVINEPGSYYLTGPLTAAKANGIRTNTGCTLTNCTAYNNGGERNHDRQRQHADQLHGVLK